MTNSLGLTSSPAARAATPTWRDPRLWIGILVVAVSVVAGVRLMAAADDSVAVWAAAEELPPGSAITADRLVAVQVRFADGSDTGRYLPVREELPSGAELVRGVGAGELVPRAALGEAGAAALVQLPVTVGPGGVPPGVGTGSRVDVYVTDDTEPGRAAELMLEGVVVVAAATASDQLGATGERQLVLGVPAEEVAGLPEVIAAASAGTVTVIGRG